MSGKNPYEDAFAYYVKSSLDAQMERMWAGLLGYRPRQTHYRHAESSPYPDAIEAEYVEGGKAPTPALPAKVGAGEVAGEIAGEIAG